MLAVYCNEWGQPLMFYTPNRTLLGKTRFSFVSAYQLEIVSGLEIGAFCLLSFLRDGTQSGLELCSLCACCHRFCNFICMPLLLYLEGLFSWCPPYSLSLTVFLPPLPQSPRVLRRICRDVPTTLEYSKVTFPNFGSLYYFFHFYCRKMRY